MTSRKTTRQKTAMKKLKVKKETIRDLDVKDRARGVKGGSGTICQTPPTTLVSYQATCLR
jgi:hypothetical protein